MQPPITTGTILQNRYRIIKTLGQGGFGRTYLTEDQRRFNELCTLKELIATRTSTSSWQKAEDLFRREAEVLYQIKHPQIPQFREQFEQDQRLFLVQDYVEGKTYRALLDERQASNAVFTQVEVMYLIQSLLPVLTYIHGKGIIHRDISPDNIILRDSVRLPVLIDFGVVKELANRLQTPSTTSNTYVGKLGYSPIEQMQTGQVYPSSDLYALAVTAIVLLTGKEPQELFDEQQLTWNWQRWVRVNPKFAQVLNRMLSYRPGDRYQSAAELAPILTSVEEGGSSNADVSQIQTIAVAHHPDAVESNTPARNNAVIPPPPTSVLDNPLVIGAIGASVVILAGFGSWALVRSVRTQQDNQSATTITTGAPQTFPSPVISASLTPTPTPTPTEELPVQRKIKRLIFNSSNTAKVDDTITSNQLVRYTFRGEAGEQITVMLVQESGVSFNVLAPNEQRIENTSENVSFYQGILPVDGEYKIDLITLPQVSESDYSLYVGLEGIAQPIPRDISTDIPSPIPTDIPSPSVTFTPSPDITVPVITPNPDYGEP